ncbi:MAG: hypothetical protein K2X35_06940 [Bryobacteraceae bacterium]|nr:hypothetical protein [Bryobacteraceae bacterium]
MYARIGAIGLILACTSVAWMILGNTISSRTGNADELLRSKVVSSWGSPHQQQPPSASYSEIRPTRERRLVDGKLVEIPGEQEVIIGLPLESSRIDVDLNLEYRQKGLLWYSTYGVEFRGAYTFRNTSARPEQVSFRLPYPAANAIYDGVAVTANGLPVALEILNAGATAEVTAPAGAAVRFEARYRSRGLDSWTYKLAQPDGVGQVRDFELRMKTNFPEIDFAENTVSPNRKQRSGAGWNLEWKYENLVTGLHIAMVMPRKLQPGPMAGQISYFAPVSLLFFFFAMLVLTWIRGVPLHPVNYFFLAASFFAFHLLLAYLVDHISIHIAFVICSVVSIFLVVSYLRVVAGMRFAAVEAGGAQFLYLVLFSYAFFFKGFTGLAVTIGAILTLFVVMQATARVERQRPRTN